MAFQSRRHDRRDVLADTGVKQERCEERKQMFSACLGRPVHIHCRPAGTPQAVQGSWELVRVRLERNIFFSPRPRG